MRASIGIKLREKMLGDPDRLGKYRQPRARASQLGVPQPVSAPHDGEVLGIHRDKKLPEFAGETFEKWLRTHGSAAAACRTRRESRPFPTCFVNYYNTAPGKALVSKYSAQERMRDRVPRAELLRDARARRRRCRLRAQTGATEYRFVIAASPRGISSSSRSTPVAP